MRYCRCWYVVCFVISLWVGFFLCAEGYAEEGDYDVKASYIYQFSRYITWPSVTNFSGDTFSVCVYGKDVLSEWVDKLPIDAGDKPLHVVHVTQDQADTFAFEEQCHVVFFSIYAVPKAELLSRLKGLSGVLVVSDISGAINTFAAMEFYQRYDEVRVAASLPRLKAADLVASSKLLRAVQVVMP